MAGAASNPPKPRKRVDVDTNSSLKRARDGSAFTRCDECGRHVPVALIDMHSCSLESRIKMHLESHVVEKAAEPKKPVQRKKAAQPKGEKKEVGGGGGGKRPKAGKDPNRPKRPVSAFFVFMAEFRQQFKEAHPDNKKVSAVAKEGGEKWKAMSEEEKKPYVERAAELKAEYDKAMEDYKPNAPEDDDEVEEVEGPDSGKDEAAEEEAVEEETAEEAAGVCEELEDDLKEEKGKKVGRRVVLSDDEE